MNFEARRRRRPRGESGFVHRNKRPCHSARDATNELTSRALSVGLKGKVLDVVVEGAYCTPQQIYVGDKHQLFVPIWTSSGGKLLGGEAAITKAIAEYHRLVKK